MQTTSVHTATTVRRANSMWVWLWCLVVFAGLSGVSHSASYTTDTALVSGEQPAAVAGQRDNGLFPRELTQLIRNQQSASEPEQGFAPKYPGQQTIYWQYAGLVSASFVVVNSPAPSLFTQPPSRAPPIC